MARHVASRAHSLAWRETGSDVRYYLGRSARVWQLALHVRSSANAVPGVLDATIDSYLAALTEPDEDRRATMIQDSWADDGRLTDPPRSANGHLGLSRLAEITLVEYPGYHFRRVGCVERRGGRIRFAWEFVNGEGVAVVRGVDSAELADDGRLHRVRRQYDHRWHESSVVTPPPDGTVARRPGGAST